MATFPRGNFTITSNDTGRCLRARLGKSKDISSWKAGTKYLLSKTDPPTLELGDDDGSPACAWYFDTAQDPQGRIPYDQIVNTGVRDLQNIGDFCVWLQVHQEFEETGKVARRVELNDIIYELLQAQEHELSGTIPPEWAGDKDLWYAQCADYHMLGAQDYLDVVRGSKLPWKGSEEALDHAMRTFCTKIIEASRKGAEAIVTRTMKMRGCGIHGLEGSTYRWATDGTYIFSTDSTNLSTAETYWTDSNGRLTGQAKGRGAQTWTIKPWTPPASKPGNLNDYALTGLFGPLATFL
ncbi:hypothetical protein [Streptomyces sp. NPDC054901]